MQNPLGAATCFTAPANDTVGPTLNTGAGCDPGFPNGRRPGDDVVDIELRVAMGFLLVDGAAVSSADFATAFPYLKSPAPGSPEECVRRRR